MGMDLNGWKGECFRGQWGDWHRLADCILALAPTEAQPCKGWYHNDGDGLNAAESLALADRLDQCIADGTAESYVQALGGVSRLQKGLFCQRCNTSLSLAACFRGVGIVDDEALACESCGNTSRKIVGETGYTGFNGLSEFALFCRHSGGFSIT